MTFGVMGGGSGDGYTGYRSPGSVRMTNASNTYRWQRTFSTTGDRTRFTLSMWIKRGTMSTSITTYQRLMLTNLASDESLRFDGDRLMFFCAGGASGFLRTFDSIYSGDGWYHIVLACDSTQATNTNRVKMYINGDQCSLGYSTGNVYPIQNYQFGVGGATFMQIGNAGGGGEGTDMCIAEVSMVDGQQLLPTSFGEYDTNELWRPKRFTGTWGTNGFYLNFSDRSSANAMGLDKSGNGQNFTMGGGTGTITGINSIISNDSPTPTSPEIANYAQFATRGRNVSTEPVDAGLTLTPGVTGIGNMGMYAGKWYWEVTAVTATAPAGLAYNVESTLANTGTVAIPAGSTYGLRFDATAGILEFTTDGSSWSTPQPNLFNAPYFVYVVAGATGTAHLNHGQRPFAFTPPSGYNRLNSYNLPDPVGDPAFGMRTKYFLGTGAAQNITGFKFAPDVVWIQRAGVPLYMFDRTFSSSTNYLQPSTTSGELSDGNSLTSFNSNGFSIGISSGINDINGFVQSYGWKVSPAYGFDRVTYTGTGVNRTVAHNLGAVPGFILIKRRDASSSWIGRFGNQPNTDFFYPTGANTVVTDATVWNSTTPTSTNISLGTNINVNSSGGSYIAYLFSEVRGYSKIGTYVGTGSSDLKTHIFCGFKPAAVIIRRMDATAVQTIIAADADLGNYTDSYAMLFGGTTTLGAGLVKFTATGFGLRSTNSSFNSSNFTYAYIAFADAPPSYCLEGGI